MLNKKEIYKRNCLKHKKNRHKEERKLISASRSLYTLAVILIQFKNTKNCIPNSIYVRKHRPNSIT